MSEKTGTWGAPAAGGSAGANVVRGGMGGGGRGNVVKNRAPAPIQITAEQLLREAKDRMIELDTFKRPKQDITDPEELAEFRQSKRKEFEDAIRYERSRMGTWIKYAHFEEQQSDFKRARSVFERAVDVTYTDQHLWLKYAEFEMRNKAVNHARNVWDRAVTLMPRVDQFWFKYSYMEEMLGNTTAARALFERWMQWEPDDPAWNSYVKFEVRQGEMALARAVHERYLAVHGTLRAYLKVRTTHSLTSAFSCFYLLATYSLTKYSHHASLLCLLLMDVHRTALRAPCDLKVGKWENRHGAPALARTVFERAVAELPAEEQAESLFVAFAAFEEGAAEYERARAIYRYALGALPEEECAQLSAQSVRFEKQHGDAAAIEDVILRKRRLQYAEALEARPTDYDTWFDLLRLEESAGDEAAVRETYERAIANVPPVAQKRYWRRYIYLWVNYALYEELVAKDAARTRAVWRACLSVIPHGAFTFAKVWHALATFEVRQLDLPAARKTLGVAIGKCPKEKLFKVYIELELQLGNVERCRTLYGKYLEYQPHNCGAWGRYAELERTVGETERCRAIYELAVTQRVLDMPEQIWKAYIDFEIAEGEHERTCTLYERLLERTSHVKVWISFATFCASSSSSAGEGEGEGDDAAAGARAVFGRARDHFKAASEGAEEGDGAKEARAMLLEAWRAYEAERAAEGDGEAQLAEVEALLPKRIKKKRMMHAEDGSAAGWEEYYDYIFPGDEKAAPNLKILEMAHAWKMAAAKRKAEEISEE